MELYFKIDWQSNESVIENIIYIYIGEIDLIEVQPFHLNGGF